MFKTKSVRGAWLFSNVLVLLLVSGAAPGDNGPVSTTAAEITSADFSAPQTWGAVENVVGIKHLYMSGQPDEATLIAARENNVAAIINMRGPDEIEWDEEAATRALGMDYYNIPVESGDHGYDENAISDITRLVGKYKNQKILLHCSSGNRVSGWLAVHLVRDHGIQVETAIELAKKANLTKPTTEKRIRESLAGEK